jgi:hypothetical protein
MRTVRLAWERVFDLQPLILERTLSIIGWKASLREEPSVNGNPKWTGRDGDRRKGIMPKMLDTLAGGVFLLKRI